MQVNRGLERRLRIDLGRQQSGNNPRFISPGSGNGIDRKYACQLSANGAKESLAKADCYKLLNDPGEYRQFEHPVDQRPPRAEQ